MRIEEVHELRARAQRYRGMLAHITDRVAVEAIIEQVALIEAEIARREAAGLASGVPRPVTR